MSHPGTNGVEAASRAKGPLSPSRVFRGKQIVVVGGTGFLGKVWVAMLLDRFPELGKMYLVVRPKQGQSVEERFWAQIASSPVFDPIREKHPGPAFEAFLRDKVVPIPGDVTNHELGLPESLLAELQGRIDAVVNVAGVVDFSPPLDEALEVNAFGVTNLASLAKRLGGVPVMHTSTCYVAGYRAGLIEEVDPRDVPFPRSMGETWFGTGAAARTLERSHWDPQREIDECLDLVKQARHRCEDSFRQSHFLDQAKKNLEERGEPCRGSALDAELAKVKRKFMEDMLVEAGTERARYWGWTNIYTYTKSIGEQVLAASGLPFTIVRPAVIESSVVFPFCGWNEGVNTSAPYIYMALKGQVQFPAAHDVRLDIIPVDMVASGMIASLAELIDGTAAPVYQYGSSDVNGCRMTRYMEIIGLYKRKKVREGKTTKPLEVISAYFESLGLSKKQYEAHGAHAIVDTLRGASRVFDKLSVGPAAALFKPAAKALASAAKKEEKTAAILDLFVPFTAECDWVYSCANTRAAIARMPEDEQARFYWQPEKIDWREYMWDVHIPGLEKWVMPLIDERMNREIKPLRRYDTLIDLLEEMAERHDHAPALQRLESDGLSRVTFRVLRESARVTAARLAARGVKPGDRVVLSGANQPAWPIAYFGILYAGAVAVPVDPALEGPQLANVIRSSGARVALWTPDVEHKGGAHARRAFPELAILDLAGTTEEPSRSEIARAPEPPAAKPSDVASVIYTSGTTGEPKGVMLSHENFSALIAALAPLFPLTERDRMLSVLPLHHTFEFSCGLLLPLSRGARILYLDELNGERLGKGLKDGRITAMAGVPALWQLLERRILSRVREQGRVAEAAFDYATELNRMLGKKAGINAGRLFFGQVHAELGGNIRYLISGGAALPKDTAKLFIGLGLPLAEGYGLTEAAPVLSVAKASMKARLGQVGKPIPGVEISIRNPDERGVGEVVARGPNVMVGYANDPEATAQVLDADGWLSTGDLGKFDERKQLVIVGRQKDVVVTASGENVYPDDLENLLGNVRYVKELAIVGIDDGKGGERVACLAVPEANDEEDAKRASARARRHDEAIEALREAFQKLPRVAQPSVVHLYDADLPRTATRKVKRPEVKAILERLALAAGAPSSDAHADGAESGVRHAIAAIANKKPPELRATMSLKGDLAFDSLMTMELSVALEAQTGRAVDPARLGRCDTVGDVETMLGEAMRGDGRGAVVDRAEEEPIVVPPVLADAAKRLLADAQNRFYERVMQPKVYGRAFIPHNRNTIVVSNHASHLDMGFVKYALGEYGRDLVSLAAQDYFFDRDRYTRAWFENFTNLVPFDRKHGLRAALRQAGDVIDQGRTLLIFPEGTRSPNGALQEFKSSIGHLALTHGVDILPIYLSGTYEALPKGGKLPTKRAIVARIGPPLAVDDLRRLTDGMKFPAACRKVAELTELAVKALRDGGVLDLSRYGHDDRPSAIAEHPLAALFRELEAKFQASRVTAPVTYYFTLGAENEAKWTLRIAPDGCVARLGKPEGAQADCVLKTSPEIFTKIVREAYTPSPMEFMTGQVKSNDISLLQTFQKAFDLG